MSSRRTSSLDKEPPEVAKTPTLASAGFPPQQNQANDSEAASKVASTNIATTPAVETSETLEQPSPATAAKERTDGRTTRARTVAIAASEEAASTTTTPVTTNKRSKPESNPPAAPAAASSSSAPAPTRQRNKSGAADNQSTTPTTPAAPSFEAHSSTETHKMTREERKLQSVLKLIERMESNQKKKESRQNQKKEKSGGKEKKPTTEDREEEHDEDSQTTPSGTTLAPIRFAPTTSAKKKGRKRGRSSSKSGSSIINNKPQMISQRNSGSIADLRSTSTESDINSADEAARAGMSPLQENVGPNFRLPKKKEMMSEWRIGGGHPSPSLPSQYMRKATTPNSAGTATIPPVHPSTSSANIFLSIPATNGNVDNASAKKRWLRQAISEETDPASVPSPNSRPSSPVAGAECLAPLKKRRLARASMSSEVSNTPPSTPNNIDPGSSEVDADGDNESEQVHQEESGGSVGGGGMEMPSRKWSCSEVSSGEEDLEDGEEPTGRMDERNTSQHHLPPSSGSKKIVEMEEGSEERLEFGGGKESGSKSPLASTPRRSRWDQVDIPEPAASNSNSNSPVKSTADAIVLDYVRNPEQYANKLTGAAAFETEKGATSNDMGHSDETSESTEQLAIESSFKGTASSGSDGGKETSYRGRGQQDRGNVQSSPKIPLQVKKKVSENNAFLIDE